MNLIELPAIKLRPGMFVAEIDRPWLETPFALQGFMVRDDEEVIEIARHVDRVYVDIDYAGGDVFLPRDVPRDNAVAGTLALRADFEQARVSFESATESLNKAFESLERGRHTDISAVKDAVSPLIDGVFKNKDAIAALVRLKESNDYLYQHGISMAVWGAILGRQIGMHRDELEKLVVGCAMCDVGMTKLPADMLQARGHLDPKQREIVRAHPDVGVELIKESGQVDPEVLAIIEAHHERWDGSGYPRGLQGANIPKLARIAGLVDAYDAMITDRPFAEARSSYEASQELADCKDTLFQGALVEQFIQAIGVFPTGCIVELSTGQVGIVVNQNPVRRLKPEVVIVTDADKNILDTPSLVDLARTSQAPGDPDALWIRRELPPGEYGINSEDYFV